jgi:hypothetical protein
MADSYAVNPGDTVAAAGGEAVPLRAGTSGGGQGYGLTLGQQPETRGLGSEIGALLKLGEKILAPKIKQEQEAQFAAGMYRVAQGEAVADIAKDEGEAWTSVWGPNYVVEGARVGSASSKANLLASEAEGNMETLALQTPEQMQKWYTNRVKEIGGDDPLFVGMAMKEGASVFKQHSKLRYRHLQNEANTADRTNIATTLGRYESKLREAQEDPSRYSEADLAEAGWEALDVLLPGLGQNPLTKQQNVVDAVKALATTGNFRAIAALQKGIGQDEKGQPIKPLANLDPKIRDDLERTLRSEGASWNWKSASDATIGKVQAFYSNAHLLDAVEAKHEIEAINKAHAAETGIDTPLMSNQDAIREALQNTAAAGKAQAKVDEAAAKKAAADSQIEHVKRFLTAPNGMFTLQEEKKRGVLKDDNFQAGQQLLWGESSTVQRLALVQNNAGYKLEVADGFFKGTFNAAMPTPNTGTLEAFELLKSMPKPLREQYLDQPTLKLLDAFEFSQHTSKNVNDAWAQAQVGARHSAELSPEERKARSKLAKEAVKDVVDKSWYEGGDDLQGFGTSVLEARAERAAQFYPYTPEGLKNATLANMRSDPAYTLLGPNVIINSLPNLPSLEDALNPGKRPDGTRDVKYTEPELAAAFHLLVNDTAKRFKVSPEDVTLIRMPDENGQPRIQVSWGQPTPQYIRGSDLTKYIDAGEVKKWQKKARASQVEEPAQPIGLASDR